MGFVRFASNPRNDSIVALIPLRIVLLHRESWSAQEESIQKSRIHNLDSTHYVP